MKYEFSGTPGPWFTVKYAGYWILQSNPYYESIDVLNEDNFEGGQAEFNARLAAAAPDLLEACIGLLEGWNNCSTSLKDLEKARKAIEKSLNIYP